MRLTFSHSSADGVDACVRSTNCAFFFVVDDAYFEIPAEYSAQPRVWAFKYFFFTGTRQNAERSGSAGRIRTVTIADQ